MTSIIKRSTASKMTPSGHNHTAPVSSKARSARSRSASTPKSSSSSFSIPRTTRARSASILRSKNARAASSSLISSVSSANDAPSFQQPTTSSMNKQKSVKAILKKAVCSKLALPLKPISPDPQDQRDNYGSARAAKESVMMTEHTIMLLNNNIIDAETAAKLSNPWHSKGELNMQWNPKYLDPALASPIDMMDLEKANRIAFRKDAAERKWLEDWKAGIIDDNGNQIVQEEESELSSVPSALPEKVVVVAEEEASAKEKENKVVSGRMSKASTPAKKIPLAPVSRVSLPTIPPPILNQSASRSRSARKNKPTNFLEPEAGFPDYEELNFFEIIAIGRERGLITGGDIWKNRERLILDDKAVRDGTERELSKYSRTRRDFKTKAPVMMDAPVVASKKRKGGDEIEEGEKKKQKVEK